MRIAQHETAVAAFHAHAGKSVQQRVRILAFFETHGGNWSIGELASAMNLEKSTVSARLNEMLETGTLIAFPCRKDHRSGITVRPVGLPISQGLLF